MPRRLGARRTMALVNRPAYGELIEGRNIDVVISPQTITIGSLLAHVRRGDVVRVHSLRRDVAEAIEVVVHGSADRSRVIGRRIGEIELPVGASIVAVVRGDPEAILFVEFAEEDNNENFRRLMRLGELMSDLGAPRPTNGDLSPWADRGVLLLNTGLTVEDGQAASHAGWGWEALTDALIADLAAHGGDKVFMLWGAHAQRKESLITATGRTGHLVLKANHPSPLSATRGPAPFIGCGHFEQASRFWAERSHFLRW